MTLEEMFNGGHRLFYGDQPGGLHAYCTTFDNNGILRIPRDQFFRESFLREMKRRAEVHRT